jgi:hypothetical protein
MQVARVFVRHQAIGRLPVAIAASAVDNGVVEDVKSLLIFLPLACTELML